MIASIEHLNVENPLCFGFEGDDNLIAGYCFKIKFVFGEKILKIDDRDRGISKSEAKPMRHLTVVKGDNIGILFIVFFFVGSKSINYLHFFVVEFDNRRRLVKSHKNFRVG